LSGSGGSYSLSLKSPVLARQVYVSFGDNDVEISDNYFDLLPNEGVTLTLKSKENVDAIRHSLKVRNITDAFLADGAR